MIASQTLALAALGTGSDAQHERARLQSAALCAGPCDAPRVGATRADVASLRADMQAFKAANPGSCLEDFIRWHSPRDWNPQHGLSARMAQPGNMWQQLWYAALSVSIPPTPCLISRGRTDARPLPAAQQPPLWDAGREGEAVVDWLRQLPVADALAHLWSIALSATVPCLLRGLPA
jgi:hypothetical protein